jgi:hypothetical protein
LSESQRARARALYVAVRGRVVAPAWVLKAWVEAAVRGGDGVEAVARAHFGMGQAGLGAGGRACVAGWATAMGAAAMAAGLGPDRRPHVNLTSGAAGFGRP